MCLSLPETMVTTGVTFGQGIVPGSKIIVYVTSDAMVCTSSSGKAEHLLLTLNNNVLKYMVMLKRSCKLLNPKNWVQIDCLWYPICFSGFISILCFLYSNAITFWIITLITNLLRLKTSFERWYFNKTDMKYGISRNLKSWLIMHVTERMTLAWQV